MARKFLTPLDLVKNELQNAVIQNLASAPSSPVKGQIYLNSTDNVLYYWDGTAWVAAKSGAPSGNAGGDLTGTYPNPTIGPSKVTSAHIADGTIVDTDVAAANKDGTAGTPSLRTLGTGATQAAPGNDSRFTDSRPPNGSAGGDLTGSYPNPQIGAGVIVDADVAAANKDGVDATPSLRTLGYTAGKAMPGVARLDQVAIPTTNVSLNSNRIVSLGTPLNPDDAATKLYADNLIQGIDAKESVKAATTVNITLSGNQTIDGVAISAGHRVLVKNQTTTNQNGIYVASASAWARATDMDAWTEVPGAFVFVEAGTTQADTGWVSTAETGGTIGTTAITWTQFSGAAGVTAGAGLLATGSVFDVVAADTSIVVAADSIRVGFAGFGSATTAAKSDHFHSTYPLKYAVSVGGATSVVVNHNFGTADVLVQVWRASAPNDLIECDIEHTDTSNVTLRFATAPAAAEYRCLVIG